MKRNREFHKNIPENPGVYILYNSREEIIYIGKAKNLKRRLSTYFQKHYSNYKTKLLKEDFQFYDFIITKTEVEALLLENNLIKKYKPKYNILLKDDKTYPYIAYNKNTPFPYFYFTRVKKMKKNTVYLGPFTDVHGVKLFIDYINDHFLLRRCQGKLPNKPCIYYSLKKCSAPCIFNDEKKYNKFFNEALKFIKTSSQQIINTIKNEMEENAQKLQFEKAAILRDLIQFLTSIKEKQYVSNQKKTFDVVSYVYRENYLLIGISHYLDGNLKGIFVQDFNNFNSNDNDEIENYLVRYYLFNFVPPLILIDPTLNKDKIEKELIRAEIKTNIRIVSKNKMEYIEQIKRNLNFQLSETLKLNKSISFKPLFPEYQEINLIDAFDISHISGYFTIGGVVRFKNGEPVKSMFRAYILPDNQGKPDDYLSIYLSVKKHLEHLKKHSYSFPNLILIDGGKGQLNMAQKVLNELNINIPLLSIAKGNKNDKLYKINLKEPIIFSKANPLMQYITKIRDTVHDYSVFNHRKKREKLILSFFDDIPLIGLKRAKSLIIHFKTLKRIYEVSDEDLEQFIPKKSIPYLRTKLKKFINS